MKKLSVSKIGVFSGHRDAVFSLCRSGQEGYIFSGAADGMVVEWDAYHPGDGRLLVQVPVPVYSLFPAPDGAGLFIGTRDGNLHLVDLKGHREARNIQAHEAGIFDIRLAGEKLITTGGDGVVKIWDAASLELLATLRNSDKSARVAAAHPAESLVAVGYSDHLIRLFDLRDYSVVRVLEGHTHSVFALAFTADGSQLLSGGRDAMLRSWDARGDYSLLREIPAHMYHVNHIALSPNGDLFSTCSLDKTIKLWDTATCELLKVIDHPRYGSHTSSVNKVIWLDSRHIVSCSDDRTLALFSVNVD